MVMTLAKQPAQIAQAAGSPPGFEALFEQHWERVCAVIYRLVGDWDEAQDLALEAFLQLHNRPPADPASLSGWLYRVATNSGLNALRARRRRQHYEQQAARQAPGWQPAQSLQLADPALVFEKGQERQRVREVLAQMKPRSAQVLVLRYSGLSYSEIAQALGVEPGSIGTLLARAERDFEYRYQRDKA
jgi:RNA polymerase sigma-70 factor (ECF subfamily)